MRKKKTKICIAENEIELTVSASWVCDDGGVNVFASS